MERKADECCPRFEPEKWDEKEFIWENKLFVKDKVCTLFYMPLNFGKVITRLMTKAEGVNALVPDGLCLSDHTSKWNMDIYVGVDKEIPGLNHETLSGKYISKVYEGNFKDTGKWCDDFKQWAAGKNYTIKKWYMWYTTCPKCAKKYGKNYVVIIAPIE